MFDDFLKKGINFNDGLARCVVMVGLPYPNSFDPILKEKMKYLDEKQKELGTSVKNVFFLTNEVNF